MNIELTDKEFRRLLDMVYIGNWILNSTRGDDRFEDYDLLQEKLFALYHPAAIIYRRELKQIYEQDVLTLRDSLTIETQK